MTLHDFLSRLDGVRRSGTGYVARCPAHDDSNPSLSVMEENGRILLRCHAGCATNTILETLGIEFRALLTSNEEEQSSSGTSHGRTESMTGYDYRNSDGELLFKVIRSPGKRFAVQRPASDGGFVSGLNGQVPVLYRLPELIAAVNRGEMVFVAEGEKDVDTLYHRGLTATTAPFGAGKWRDDFNVFLKQAHVVLLPDNDEPGRRHMNIVQEALSGIAASVRIIELP